ncbi:MAG: M56 family metallopeptidase [Patescibacteria group bacterium]|nr:M56 family metallopeptidase [Patescibacteria group bacterium]MCL6096652.1 M56 family metallopeptidase [Patescibacteria group bacterium]
MRNINSNLWKFIGIALIFGSGVFLLFFKFWPLLSHNTIYYCKSFLTGNVINIPPVFHIILTGIFFSFLTLIFIKISLIFVQSYRFKKYLTKRFSQDKKIIPALKELDLLEKVIVIEGSKPFAFCLGIHNPKIYISSETLKIMNDNELKAILLHEKYHLNKNDGLIMLVASLSIVLFPFLPIISDLVKRYRLEREITADQQVISKMGKEPIISVLKKLLTFPSVPMLTASSIADFDTIKSRVSFLNDESFPRKRYKKVNLVISIFSLIIFGVFIATPVQATKINVNNQETMMVCVNNEDCAALCRRNSALIDRNINYSKSNNNASYPYSSIR